ncbi:MAG: TIGR00297 family protein, partial [Thermoanaerobaculia bacterium]
PPPYWFIAVLAGAVAFALLESVRAGIEDNLVAPLPAALVIAGVLSGGAGAWLRLWSTPDFLGDLAMAAGVNAGVALLMWFLRAVTVGGAVAGFLIGSLILALGGWAAYGVLWTFFLAGTLATRLGYRIKAARGVAQTRGGRRGASHAVANCVVAAGILVATAGYRPFYPDLLIAGFAGAFAAALSDTMATEVGGLYGRRPFSPLRLERLPAGTPGAVSWPGLIASLAGAAIVAVAARAMGLISSPLPWAVATAGFLGSFAESAVNDLARRQGWRLDHELANGFNTFVGAMAAMGISALMRQGTLFVPIDST